MANIFTTVFPSFQTVFSFQKGKKKKPNGEEDGRTNVPHSLSVIPRNILAFRTITTLLHLFQQERPFQILESVQMLPADLQELKIANAVSTVAVASFDVVAVSTKRTSEAIQVLACAHDDNVNPNPSNIQSPLLPLSPPPLPPTPTPKTFLGCTWHWSCIRNPRKDEDKDKYNASDPDCIIPTIPTITKILAAEDGLVLETDQELKEYLNNRWSKFNRTSTLATHMWTLQRILTMNKSDTSKKAKEDISDLLRRYVIATCYPKMLHRLNSQLSRPYIKSLKQVSALNIQSQFAKDALENPHPPKDSSLSAKQDRLVRRLNDKDFLAVFTNPTRLSTQIPNLSIQARLAAENSAENSATFELYTYDTCAEFHCVLVEYLERLHISLARLDTTTSDPETFSQHLTAVLLSSCALQRIANGSALQRHLRVIATLIDRNNHSLFNDHSVRRGKPEIIADEELEAVQPSVIAENGQQRLLSQSYEEWLRLMLVHFDAVDILVDYVKGKNFHGANISAQILTAPPVNESLLSLKELLEDSEFLSDTANTTQSNEDILDFFKSATSNGVDTFLQHIKGASKNWGNRQLSFTIDHVDKMVQSPSGLPGSWIEGVNKLKALLDQDPIPKADVTDLIDSLKKSAIFFGPAGRFQTKMKTFSGSLHCEVCLASLLGGLATNITINSECRDVMEQLKGFGRVIGVSKRCCPTCRHLLLLLKDNTPQPFLTRGFHNTVTPCTLPPWLPAHIVDSMNLFFGRQLRKELVDFIGRSNFSQPRAASTGSGRLSFDLTEGQGTHGSQRVTDATYDAAGWSKDYAVVQDSMQR